MLRSRRRLLSVPLLLPFVLSGCEREPDRSTPVRPPVIVDDATMTRLLAAMRELQDLARTRSAAQLPSNGELPIGGVGVSGVLGEAALPIVRKHGFANTLEFESKVAWTQKALVQLQFQGRHGFDGDAQLYRLRGKRSDLQARRLELERDAELSDDMRRQLLTEVRLQLEDVEDRIDEVNDFAETMDQQFEDLPAENLQSVRDHLDELLALLSPDGALQTRSTPAPVAGPGSDGE